MFSWSILTCLRLTPRHKKWHIYLESLASAPQKILSKIGSTKCIYTDCPIPAEPRQPRWIIGLRDTKYGRPTGFVGQTERPRKEDRVLTEMHPEGTNWWDSELRALL